MKALSELLEEGALSRDEIRVVFMSNLEIGGDSIKRMAREYSLHDVVQCTGYIPYDQCMSEMRRADVLLLFSIRQPLQIPAKLYEYIALGKPVLSISTGGVTDEIVDRTGTGINVKPDDISAMKRAIMALISGGGPIRNEQEIAKYDMRTISRNLSNDLESLLQLS